MTPFFKRKAFKSSSSGGTYQRTETAIFLAKIDTIWLECWRSCRFCGCIQLLTGSGSPPLLFQQNCVYIHTSYRHMCIYTRRSTKWWIFHPFRSSSRYRHSLNVGHPAFWLGRCAMSCNAGLKAGLEEQPSTQLRTSILMISRARRYVDVSLIYASYLYYFI